MLPFKPETIEALKVRYPAALERVFDVRELTGPVDDRPGLKREHVFDFEDGLRLIVSREMHDRGLCLHLSASMAGPTGQAISEEGMKEFAAFVMRHILLLWNATKFGVLN